MSVAWLGVLNGLLQPPFAVLCIGPRPQVMAASSGAYRGACSVSHNVCTLLFLFSLAPSVSAVSYSSSHVPDQEKQALLRIRQELAIFANASVLDEESLLLPWDPEQTLVKVAGLGLSAPARKRTGAP